MIEDLRWIHSLEMQRGLDQVYFRWQAWHPYWGLRTWDAFSLEPDFGQVTDTWLRSQLWTGSTELLERGTGA